MNRHGRIYTSAPIAFLVIWAIYSLLWLCAFSFVPILYQSTPDTDFRTFYSAGVLARTDPSHIYDRQAQERIQSRLGGESGILEFVQPPYEALLVEPFTTVPYRKAYLLWMAFNLALLLGSFLVSRDAFSSPIEVWQPRPGLMFFFFVPLMHCLLHGQSSIRLLFLCCAAWHELNENRDLSAGALVGLALFKLNIAIPLAAFLIFRRGAKFLIGFSISAVLTAAISIAVFGPSSLIDFVRTLTTTASQPSSGTNVAAIYMPNLRGLLYGLGGRLLTAHSFSLIVVLVSAAIFALLAFCIRRTGKEDIAFAVACIGALLLSYHLHIHDLALLLLPLGLLSRYGARPVAIMISPLMLPVSIVFTSNKEYVFAFGALLIAILIWVAAPTNMRRAAFVKTDGARLQFTEP